MNGGLSFLRKQESRLFDGPGFRIKCGMTALEGHLTEYDLKKQSQFAEAQMDVKSIITKDYKKIHVLGGRKNKPEQSQFPAPRLRNFHENQLADNPELGNNSLNANNQIIEGYRE